METLGFIILFYFLENLKFLSKRKKRDLLHYQDRGTLWRVERKGEHWSLSAGCGGGGGRLWDTIGEVAQGPFQKPLQSWTSCSLGHEAAVCSTGSAPRCDKQFLLQFLGYFYLRHQSWITMSQLIWEQVSRAMPIWGTQCPATSLGHSTLPIPDSQGGWDPGN